MPKGSPVRQAIQPGVVGWESDPLGGRKFPEPLRQQDRDVPSWLVKQVPTVLVPSNHPILYSGQLHRRVALALRNPRLGQPVHMANPRGRTNMVPWDDEPTGSLPGVGRQRDK